MEQALPIVIRVVHIGSAIALLGGAVFFLVVMLPAVKLLDEGLRSSILQLARKRFYRITHPAIVLLLVTGFYTYLVTNWPAYEKAPRQIHMLLGIKILLALAIMLILFAQTFGVLKGCPARWTKINIAMGIASLRLSGL
jgi:uncharacterized membrane protein